ncbi:MAG: thioredoxin [Gammaproteobacteria bacterium RBG_16_57_12]|nr:MAG: thioredoxin [Gammaproteobacteria bacterium RBG_16_57_12]
MTSSVPANRLIHETSPYLLQHAHNPADWYPWGGEALARARSDDKPILLSIGYSACHWCHVMAHESFEDAATAQVMNELFINIKVDREERPDLDRIYQSAHQLLTQRGGGWPLTVFLTPDDLYPYFVGTYFPNAPRHGLPSFIELMKQVAGFYRERLADIREQNASLAEALRHMDHIELKQEVRLVPGPLDIARRQLGQIYDASHGGFGQAPKFPHPTHCERLLRHWAATRETNHPDTQALAMVTHTLKAMAHGGIYDQLGGGFCRYAVDENWRIPHFEKMLYDNGPLLTLYAQAWQATGETLFRQVAEDTAEWVLREMQSPEGGYYASLDADVHGAEGHYYVWDRDEIKALLDRPSFELFARAYGLDQAANFEGRWHLYQAVEIEELARQTGTSVPSVEKTLKAARKHLLELRAQRMALGRDEKILTSWNALMIKGMAVAGRLLQRPEYIVSAERAVAFIRSRLYRDGRLLACSKDGRAHLMAYLDDYVFLIDALLELLQVRWNSDDLRLAVALADTVLAHFHDPAAGGFFFTADDHEPLIHRPRPLADDALPAGNGIAAQALLRLGFLLGEPRYLDAAQATLVMAWENLSQAPYAHNALLLALEESLYPTQIAVLRGPARDLPAWQRLCQRDFRPRLMCLAISDSAAGLPEALARKTAIPGQLVAYVCAGTECQAPLLGPAELENLG